MESKLQVSDKGDLLDFSLDGGIATQGTAPTIARHRAAELLLCGCGTPEE